MGFVPQPNFGWLVGLFPTDLQSEKSETLRERTLNLFILAGQDEEIELEIQPDGSIEP